MINALERKFIPLGKAGRLISTNPSTATLYRWALKGVDGVRLESYLVGGRRFTTAEALASFVNRASECRPPGAPPATSRQAEASRASAAERAEAIFGPSSNA
jgi:hypothetical protein